MHAVEANKVDSILVLREFHEVNWNSKDHLGFSVAMIAVKNLHLDILEILLTMPDIEMNSFNKAGKGIAEIAIECTRKADFKGKAGPESSDKIKCIEMLSKDTRVDWNNKNENGETPVVRILKENQVEIGKILLQTPGVDLDITDKDGLTLEQIARYVST